MLESSSIRVLAPLTGLARQLHIGDFLAEFGSAKEIMVTSSLVHIYLYAGDIFCSLYIYLVMNLLTLASRLVTSLDCRHNFIGQVSWVKWIEI